MIDTPMLRQPLAQLEKELMTLSGYMNAGEYRLLELIYALHMRDDWWGPGLKSLAHFLNWRIGLELSSAREKIRVAKALPNLPLIAAAFREGEVSYSKARAMTRIATPENEAFLLEYARHGTASHVERLVRVCRYMSVDEANKAACAQRERRSVEHYFDHDGMLHIHALLPAEDGMIFLAALERYSESIRRECEADDGASSNGKDVSAETRCGTAEQGLASAAVTENGLFDVREPEKTVVDGVAANIPIPAAVRWQKRYADAASPVGALRADALVRLCSGGKHAVQPEIVVHTDAGTLRKAHFHDGPGIGSDTARRLACDALVRGLIKGAGEQPLTLGRRHRMVSKSMRRMLELRDRGCRYPGCTQRHHLHAHHIRHWADGGETSLENMVMLCSYHHHLVHEGGHKVERCAGGELRFTDEHATPVPFVADWLPASRMGVAGLQQDTNERAITITPRTAECLWDGTPPDLNMAVRVLQDAQKSAEPSTPQPG